ncbi:estradiol 17-beta-dehydrogenase 8 [Copidosoma floridanum]|uniref:estradiol 17-beta-dehydrogenase 8 n=1 Tax=Copidosoma floridanum TaxID=29053 RepID=UPI0006C943EB|nr:estradiol 17-beta-dehydrogenase 8 [Copidosoma floridanum]
MTSVGQLLAGKLAIVTGAGSGIGRAVCNTLASQGAKVIAADRNVKAAGDTVATLQGSEHVSVEMDVGNSKSVVDAFNTAKRHFQAAPTVVVNSAGVAIDNFILKTTEEDFDMVIRVNLKGTFLVTQHAVREMIDAGVAEGASIINLGSYFGKVGNMGQSHYSASKAGIEALSKCAAKEFAQFGVRVNTVLPGYIETPMTAFIPEKLKEKFIRRIPMKRTGQPIEAAEVIAFLASDKSSYINGASIDINGGIN